jgi:hypothetical protein
LIPIGLLFGIIVFQIGYGLKYAHQHCIKQAAVSFLVYAEDHAGKLPYSTNGFGNALLLLAQNEAGDDPNYFAACTHSLCGPGDDGHVLIEAFKNNAIVPEAQCSRVYIQGLSKTNNPQICILFDRDSCRGGDHSRSPWGRRVREVCLLDGSMQVIPDEKWPEFSREQVGLLVAVGFSQTNALRYYPAAQ